METNATTPGESARAVLRDDMALQDKRRTELAKPAARQDAVAEFSPPSPVEAPLALEAPPQSKAVPRDTALPDRATQGGEIELKLLVDADHLADFNAAPVIATNARNKGARKHLKSVYYDTPERTLRRNGLSLRVRQSGARFVQTVKCEFADDALRRGEWEATVSSMAPDLALAMPLIPNSLREELQRQSLQAVFTSDIHRLVRMVELPSGTVEVAFDQGVLKAGERAMPVGEIELELKRGSVSAVWELALRLAEHGPVKPSVRAKSARGFELADDAAPKAGRPRKLRLDPSICLDDAFASVLSACLCHLLESLPAAEDGRDPEGVHQLRVSLRRLRSALDLMRSVGMLSKLDGLRSEARWLAQNLSAARDLDIFQGETLPRVAKACPSVAGFDALKQVTSRRRKAAYRKVRLALADHRCARFIIDLGGWIEARGWRGGDVAPERLGRLAAPAIGFAGMVLSVQHAKVLKRGRHFKSLGTDKLHRLRLAGKKMRYLADFLLPLYEDCKSVKQFSRKLADLQEELGAFNDMAVTSSLLDGLGAESSESGTAAAAIAGWQAHASMRIGSRLKNSWRDFVKTRLPWVSEAET